MKKLFGILVALGLAATPSLAQKITIDYAHDFDFSKVSTFQYVPTKESNSDNPLMDDRIKNAVLEQLKAGGLEQVDDKADLGITYHLATKDNTVYNTTGFGYGGYGRGWGGWGGGVGMSSATTTATTFTEGTLIVDAYETAEKKMVWRGTGTVTLKSKPEKQAQQVEKIMLKMGDKWEKILTNKGK